MRKEFRLKLIVSISVLYSGSFARRIFSRSVFERYNLQINV